MLGYLIARASLKDLPELPVTSDQLLAAGAAVNLLLVLIAFAVRPGGGSALVKVSWSFGAFIGLIAAIVDSTQGITRPAVGPSYGERLAWLLSRARKAAGFLALMKALSGLSVIARGPPHSGACPASRRCDTYPLCPRGSRGKPRPGRACGSR
jgi:hypothetical protein